MFVFGHLFANYKAVKSVIMQTFNRNRYHLLAQNYLNDAKIQSPYNINKMEPVLRTVKRYFKDIKLGCSINQFERINSKQLDLLTVENYLINFNIKSILLII